MKWLIDLDGVITANPSFWKWWVYHLRKKPNHCWVGILTARNPKRVDETLEELKFWGIEYDEIYFMDAALARSFKSQGEWKRNMLLEIQPDVWVEDQLKVYERACGVDFSVLLEKGLEIIKI